MRRTLAAVGLIAVLAAGCGGGDDDASSGSAERNQADVTFAQGMVPHHEQAVEMADMALQKAQDPRVKDLANRIKAAQGPEIAQMRGWLEDWGEPAGGGDMGGMDMGGGNMGGGNMGGMSDAEMKELEAASGVAFDRMFLEGMIRHHEQAVAMARDEVQNGQFRPAKELAQRIVDSQTAEIAEIRGLLGS